MLLPHILGPDIAVFTTAEMERVRVAVLEPLCACIFPPEMVTVRTYGLLVRCLLVMLSTHANKSSIDGGFGSLSSAACFLSPYPRISMLHSPHPSRPHSGV